MNFDKPTPIQAATIPIALLGRDICACAVTGSGMAPNSPLIQMWIKTQMFGLHERPLVYQ